MQKPQQLQKHDFIQLEFSVGDISDSRSCNCVVGSSSRIELPNTCEKWFRSSEIGRSTDGDVAEQWLVESNRQVHPSLNPNKILQQIWAISQIHKAMSPSIK
jgi:hypothetical protein